MTTLMIDRELFDMLLEEPEARALMEVAAARVEQYLEVGSSMGENPTSTLRKAMAAMYRTDPTFARATLVYLVEAALLVPA